MPVIVNIADDDYEFTLYPTFAYGKNVYQWPCDTCETEVGEWNTGPFVPYFGYIKTTDRVDPDTHDPDFTGTSCISCTFQTFEKNGVAGGVVDLL